MTETLFMGLFSFFFKKRKSSREDILNSGLRFLLITPFDFNIDLAGKLSKKYPFLTKEEIAGFEIICRNANKFGHDIIYETMVNRLKVFDPMTRQELKILYRREMANRFTWVSKRNLKSIYNLASYSLGHDGWYEFKG